MKMIWHGFSNDIAVAAYGLESLVPLLLAFISLAFDSLKI